MAVRSLELIPAKQAESVQTTQYTASVTAYIDKFTVTNNSAANVTFSANLVANSGAAGTSNLVIALRTIAQRETYLCPELVGQVLDPGSFISTITSSSAALTIRASGREIT